MATTAASVADLYAGLAAAITELWVDFKGSADDLADSDLDALLATAESDISASLGAIIDRVNELVDAATPNAEITSTSVTVWSDTAATIFVETSEDTEITILDEVGDTVATSTVASQQHSIAVTTLSAETAYAWTVEATYPPTQGKVTQAIAFTAAEVAPLDPPTPEAATTSLTYKSFRFTLGAASRFVYSITGDPVFLREGSDVVVNKVEVNTGTTASPTWVQAPSKVGSRLRHGIMDGAGMPQNGQGVDSAAFAYPYNESLVKALDTATGKPKAMTFTGKANYLCFRTKADPPILSAPYNESYRTQVDDVVALTVLETPPAGGFFRPAFADSDVCVTHKASDVKWDRLANLALPTDPSAPTWGYVESKLESILPNIMGFGGSSARSNFNSERLRPLSVGIPAGIRPVYGADVHLMTGLALAMVNSAAGTEDQKRRTVYLLIQRALDMLALVKKDPYVFANNGGHYNGYRALIMFAGYMLDDETIVKKGAADPLAAYFFGEQHQFRTWYTGDPPVAAGFWGSPKDIEYFHQVSSTAPTPTTRNYAFCCTASVLTGHLIAMKSMGLIDDYGCVPLIRFVDEYLMDSTVSWNLKSRDPWLLAMYQKHYNP